MVIYCNYQTSSLSEPQLSPSIDYLYSTHPLHTHIHTLMYFCVFIQCRLGKFIKQALHRATQLFIDLVDMSFRSHY